MAYNSNLPDNMQGVNDPGELEPRVLLYNEYGNLVFESMEQFCDRMSEEYGESWIELLTSRK